MSWHRVEFMPSRHTLSNHVVMHDLLRRQTGSEVTGRVRLRAAGEACVAAPEEIQLHPLFDVVRRILCTCDFLQPENHFEIWDNFLFLCHISAGRIH